MDGGEPELSYEDVDVSIIPPRPRLYGLVGGEDIEEAWKRRKAKEGKRNCGGSGEAVAASEPDSLADERDNDMIDQAGNGQSTRHSFDVRILRQDGPGQPSYWERHRVVYQPDMNVISVLQSIAAQSTSADGRGVSPVAWDCNCLEEVCGACTMVINGRVRQACSASR